MFPPTEATQGIPQDIQTEPEAPTLPPPMNQSVDTKPESDDEGDEEYVDPLDGEESLQKAVMDILHDFDLIEETTRNYNIRTYKKCENYWHHIQNNYWSEYAGDWRTPAQFFEQNPDQPFSDVDLKITNIYRAHGESIVAALSVKPPSVRFFPNDADRPEDITSAKAHSKIGKMIERQNKAKLLLMRMIYILYNQGFVAVHNYSHESEEYGVVQKPKYGKKKVHYSKALCAVCGETLSEEGPSDEVIKEPSVVPPTVCPTCENEVVPLFESTEDEVRYQDGTINKSKCRQKLVPYGPLNVKVSSYAYDQRSVGILVLDSEQAYAKAQDMYPNIADKIRPGTLTNDTSVSARTPNTVVDAYTKNNVTVRQFWLRPWMFNAYTKSGDPHEDAIVQALKKKFPNGACIHAVNDLYAESQPESLDAAWSISFNPMSRYIHSDPIGLGMLDIQDMKNTLVNLQVQSVEFGIPETFVDSEILDLEAYAKNRGGPGMTFPVKVPIPGTAIGNYFFSNKQATLTDEAGRLEDRVDASGQFISGDYPSIYGGPNSGDTAAEYSMSRQQALQRLSTTWTILGFLWADVIKRSVEGYISNLKEDEYYVEKEAENFINIWIKKSELAGSVGECYPEESEQFPTSWAQQREVMMQLITMQSPLMETVIADPNNRTEIAKLLGLEALYIPGEQDRRKQLDEISVLVQAEPIDTGIVNPQTGQADLQSTIQPEKIDDHRVHIDTAKHWMNSEVGQYYKENKPSRYLNVMLHMEAHEMMEQAMMMSMGQTGPGQPEPTAGSGVN